jgi:hypothetical protein
VTLENEELTVEVDATDVFTGLDELLEKRLRTVLSDERLAARPVLDAVRSKLPARVRGRNSTFHAIAGGGAWAALRDPTIAVSGIGPLPERLVLDRIGPDDVQSSFSEWSTHIQPRPGERLREPGGMVASGETTTPRSASPFREARAAS